MMNLRRWILVATLCALAALAWRTWNAEAPPPTSVTTGNAPDPTPRPDPTPDAPSPIVASAPMPSAEPVRSAGVPFEVWEEAALVVAEHTERVPVHCDLPDEAKVADLEGFSLLEWTMLRQDDGGLFGLVPDLSPGQSVQGVMWAGEAPFTYTLRAAEDDDAFLACTVDAGDLLGPSGHQTQTTRTTEDRAIHLAAATLSSDLPAELDSLQNGQHWMVQAEQTPGLSDAARQVLVTRRKAYASRLQQAAQNPNPNTITLSP